LIRSSSCREDSSSSSNGSSGSSGSDGSNDGSGQSSSSSSSSSSQRPTSLDTHWQCGATAAHLVLNSQRRICEARDSAEL
jgi:hypothetical protein